MSIYSDGKYLKKHATWHEEDSTWKAKKIKELILANGLRVKSFAEIGCGSGRVLHELSEMPQFWDANFVGYEISSQALEIAKAKENKRVTFHLDLPFNKDRNSSFDVLLVIDVLEHVENYLDFLTDCRSVAKYHVFHIPLEIHVSAIFRKKFVDAQRQLGHLHFFTAELIMEAIREKGYELIDVQFTDGAYALFRNHPSFKRGVANVFRKGLSIISKDFAARVLGGYSLLLLTKGK